MILTIQMMIMVTAFCCVIFLLLPAEIDMRDQIDWGTMSAWEDALFTFIHSSDNPWNAWPSLHIVHSYILARVMTHWMIGRRASSPVPWNFAIFILWLEWTLLAISILTTKQHYMFDLVTASLLHILHGWPSRGPCRMHAISARVDSRRNLVGQISRRLWVSEHSQPSRMHSLHHPVAVAPYTYELQR